MIHEAASYVSDKELELDVDDVVEFIGDTVPPLLSDKSSDQVETESPTEVTHTVKEMLIKIAQWTKTKKKFEVRSCQATMCMATYLTVVCIH